MNIDEITPASSTPEAQNLADKPDVPIPDNTDTPTPMDTTPDKHNIGKADINGKDTGNLGAEITWKEYIKNLGETDIDSIKEGEYMTCAIIRVVMRYSQEWLRKKGKKVTCLEPSIVQMMQNEDASKEDDNEVSVKNLIRDLDLENSEYIFSPVNDNVELCKDAGDHWSLLVY